jgi:PAS domain S-box-containing protein
VGSPAPLRRALALRIAFAALVPILAVSVLVLTLITGDTERTVAERNLLLARAVSGQVQGFLREPRAILMSLRGVLLEGAAASPEERSRLLDAVVRSSDLFESIYLIRKDGTVEEVGLLPENASRRPDYVELNLSHQNFHGLERPGEASWSDTFLSILSDKMSLALVIPVGERLLMGIFNVERLSHFTRGLQERSSVRISIVDRGGALIVHPDERLALRQVKVGSIPLVARGIAGEEATGQFTFEGREYVGGVCGIPGPGWVVLVAQEERRAYEPVRKARRSFAGAFLGAVGIALVFAWTQANRFARPLMGFAAQARVVASGKYDFSPQPGGSREVVELASSFQQMTEAVRERERRLLESEEKYRLLVENAGDAIFVVQEDRICFANARTLETLGLGRDELELTPWEIFIHPQDRQAVLDGLRQRVSGGGSTGTQTLRILRRDGRELWVLLHSVRIAWEEQPATLNFLRDITEMKRLEAQALQAQKMEAVGTLAGGIAHDFNNLLQAIQGYADLARLPGRTPEQNRNAATEISRSAQRGADLTRQLLTFSRKTESRRKPLDLNGEIVQASKLLERTMPKMIRITYDLALELPAVNGDATQLQQVLLNLAVNAKDAMPDGGTLFVGTRLELVHAASGLPPEVLPGPYVLLTVADTGVGIDERTRDHIFEPFFTTKGPGEGTGLGLAMVYGIVKGHDGHVLCASAPGQGTTFKIYLPVSAGREAAVPEAEPAASVGGGETLLVVDDEASVRAVVAEALSGYGYTVLTAEDGERALERYAADWRRIDLVILDLMMPGMGGGKCLDELLRVNPAARVVVVSGYSADGSAEEVVRRGARGYIGKPVMLHRLLWTVREVLDGRTAS